MFDKLEDILVRFDEIMNELNELCEEYKYLGSYLEIV